MYLIILEAPYLWRVNPYITVSIVGIVVRVRVKRALCGNVLAKIIKHRHKSHLDHVTKYKHINYYMSEKHNLFVKNGNWKKIYNYTIPVHIILSYVSVCSVSTDTWRQRA